uniref:Uncharacterized protein n=1 Tax=Arundo donax TaxID=35708 RepID=A0A0A9CGR8_ARUDO
MGHHSPRQTGHTSR